MLPSDLTVVLDAFLFDEFNSGTQRFDPVGHQSHPRRAQSAAAHGTLALTEKRLQFNVCSVELSGVHSLDRVTQLSMATSGTEWPVGRVLSVRRSGAPGRT